ncbi:hypothetical protein SAMN04490356_0886 [Streptomyces melanosporofaciens]|uniref:Uncharacterized protein n=1 Tax=Streptomyces melanosporofaciens TaxID=67327 RepID=A0A1H4KPV4_STRMJ|nr:hypothetical protein SAMN04490356_0886 [Streptomyces melanosporofaciens]
MSFVDATSEKLPFDTATSQFVHCPDNLDRGRTPRGA